MCPDELSGRYCARGAARGRGLFREVRQEQGLVDAALEDRYAHLHALLDHLAALKAGLPGELRGREMDCHQTATSRAVCHVHRKVASPPDALNRICSIWAKHSGRSAPPVIRTAF